MALPYPYVLGFYSPEAQVGPDGSYTDPVDVVSEPSSPGIGGIMTASSVSPLIQRQYG